eukprot:1158470-Pelagomonas_calceolata.AAC.6
MIDNTGQLRSWRLCEQLPLTLRAPPASSYPFHLPWEACCRISAHGLHLLRSLLQKRKETKNGQMDQNLSIK